MLSTMTAPRPASLGPPAAPAAVAPFPAALSPEQVQELDAARFRARTLRRAALWASMDGWTIAVFGGLSILVGIASAAGWIVGGVLLALGIIEIRAASALRRLEVGAPQRLAVNQIVLGGLLLAYACWGLWWAAYGQIDALDRLVGETQGLALPELESLVRLLALVLYATLAAVAVIVPGLSAVYYWTRKPHLQAYLEHTPGWIMDLQRRGVSL
jgi:hypothetical protein